MQNTTILFIRHGQIDANVKKHWHGSTDSSLNAVGEQQAIKLGAVFQSTYTRLDALYSSPLKRTLATAEPVADANDLVTRPLSGVREYSIGEWEGLSYESLAREQDFFARLQADETFAPQGGESPPIVRDRMLASLVEILDRHPGETVAVVSHGAAMAILFAHLFANRSYPFHEYHMSNTGVTEVKFDGKNPQLVSFDQCIHLGDQNAV